MTVVLTDIFSSACSLFVCLRLAYCQHTLSGTEGIGNVSGRTSPSHITYTVYMIFRTLIQVQYLTSDRATYHHQATDLVRS